jgi:hypothetical protein
VKNPTADFESDTERSVQWLHFDVSCYPAAAAAAHLGDTIRQRLSRLIQVLATHIVHELVPANNTHRALAYLKLDLGS